MIQYCTALFTRRLSWLLLWYSFSRIVFLVVNWNAFQGVALSTIAQTLLHGIRFDLSLLVMINGLWLLSSFWPQHWVWAPRTQQGLRILTTVFNTIALGFNYGDAFYYSFIGKRSTWTQLTDIRQDATEQALHLLTTFWPVSVLILINAWLLYRYWPMPQSPWKPRQRLPLLGIQLLLIGLSILALRGGLQTKPISPQTAYTQKPEALGALALNTPFVLVKTYEIRHENVSRQHLVQERDVREMLQKSPYGLASPLPGKPNVVILLLESFAAEYTGFLNGNSRYTPFLDSLARAGLAFRHHFANGRTSLDAVPAVTAGIPHLMESAFITSPYQTNRLESLASILAQNGYHTSFYHGANNGSMSFDQYCKRAGFQQYYGKNEYLRDVPDGDQDLDGAWGVYDLPFLNRMAKNLSQYPSPFFSTVFTISSHHPYVLPPGTEQRYLPGTLPIHPLIRYTDDAVRHFFETAAKEPWYKNTVFIITADHTQQQEDPAYNTVMGRYHIPLILFAPGFQLPPANLEKTTQQADIQPTVLDLLGIHRAPRLPFSQSVFADGPGSAMTWSTPFYFFFQYPYYLQWQEQKSQLYNHLDQEIQNDSLKSALETSLKTIIQFHHNGLLENSWYH